MSQANTKIYRVLIFLDFLYWPSFLRYDKKAVFRIHLRDLGITSLMITEALRLSSRGEWRRTLVCSTGVGVHNCNKYHIKSRRVKYVLEINQVILKSSSKSFVCTCVFKLQNLVWAVCLIIQATVIIYTADGREFLIFFFCFIAYFLGFIHFGPNCGVSNYLCSKSIFHVMNRSAPFTK